MVPIQLWLPMFTGGAQSAERQRDITRAHEAWDRDHIVWMIPSWKGPDIWGEKGLRVRALASEEIECCRILHVGKNERIVGPSGAAFLGGTVKGLLNLWLQERDDTYLLQNEAQDKKRTFYVDVPNPVDGDVAYSEQKFEVMNVSTLPMSQVDCEKQKVRLVVGGEPGDPCPISPELESQRSRYMDSRSTQNARLMWAPPFDAVGPKVISLDNVMARAEMRSLAEEAQEHPAKVLKKARTRSKPWLSDGTSTENLAWFTPIIAEEGERGALFALEARFNIAASSLSAAYQLAECQSALRRPTAVRCAWGLTGLMWALFIDRLKAGIGFNFCKRCGRLIEGRANRDYCPKKQNPECRRGYERERKRSKRA